MTNYPASRSQPVYASAERRPSDGRGVGLQPRRRLAPSRKRGNLPDLAAGCQVARRAWRRGED